MDSSDMFESSMFNKNAESSILVNSIGLGDAVAPFIRTSKISSLDAARLRYIPILQELLRAGADPRAIVTVKDGLDTYAIDVVKRYLKPDFPAESWQLLRDLQDHVAREATKLTTQERSQKADNINDEKLEKLRI
jgi:hypothetical protein